MPDYDFTNLTEEKTRRRRRRDEEEYDEPRKRIDHIEVALIVLAALSGLLGGTVFIKAKTVIHEIAALEFGIIAAILLVGGLIYGKMGRG